MKPKGGSTRREGARPGSGAWNSKLPRALPLEWMDPMSWRLPSGKALAEFALQAGFLAPLILNGPRLKKKKISSGDTPVKMAESSLRHEEVPEPSGTFRGQR